MVILKKRVAGLTERSMQRFLSLACRTAGLQGTVNVLVSSNRELRALNRRFRGKNQATDVLSFPALPGPKNSHAGDIAISVEIAGHHARRLGHKTAQEVKILILHGVLHLQGFDHERDRGEMARREQKLRRALRLPSGLIERTQSECRRRRA